MSSRLFHFAGGSAGRFVVESMSTVCGAPLPLVERVEIAAGGVPGGFPDAAWVLRGVTSNERYVTRDEKGELVRKQVPLGRGSATRAAIIPIRKTAEWWGLTQEERREIFEEQSRHIRIGLKSLPAVARRLHHCRDLGEPAAVAEFDFITLFDYAPEDAGLFEELVAELRATPEWAYVEREVDLRLCYDPAVSV